jgi:hypothetical protein
MSYSGKLFVIFFGRVFRVLCLVVLTLFAVRKFWMLFSA